jgi:hypothetical protein
MYIIPAVFLAPTVSIYALLLFVEIYKVDKSYDNAMYNVPAGVNWGNPSLGDEFDVVIKLYDNSV